MATTKELFCRLEEFKQKMRPLQAEVRGLGRNLTRNRKFVNRKSKRELNAFNKVVKEHNKKNDVIKALGAEFNASQCALMSTKQLSKQQDINRRNTFSFWS